MITFIITNFIIIDFLLKLFIGTLFFYIYNRNQTLNLFKYKINSFFCTWLFSIFYISLFIVIIQLLRILNVNRTYDLKVLCFYVKIFYYNISFISLIYIILFFIILLFLLLLILNQINNFFTNEMFKLLIYHYYRPHHLKTKYHFYFMKIKFLLTDMNKTDLITYSLFRFTAKLTRLYYGKFDNRKLPRYYPYNIFVYIMDTKYRKYYNLFIILSPLYVIIYDAIYNDYIISHLYKYLLFYTPIMLIRKISMFMATRANILIEGIWPVFYDPKPGIYAVSKDIKKILDFYLKTNLNNNNHILLTDGINSDFDLPITLQERIYYNIEFIQHDEIRNTYRNSECIYLKMLEDGKVFRELENPDIRSDIEDEYMYLAEEWILLVDKTKPIIRWNYDYNKIIFD